MSGRLRRTLLRAFGVLPMGFRLELVRLVSPSYIVGSVCVVERSDGAVLLVRHSYRPHWGLPGGLARRREEPADAARREAREEIGVAVELVGDPAVVIDVDERRVDVVYAARLEDGIEPGQATPVSAEIDECRWFATDALPVLQAEAAAALAALRGRPPASGSA